MVYCLSIKYFERWTMKDLLTEIQKVKNEKNAVILAHYYAPPEAQRIADFVGDSYYLAKAARATGAELVVFAGVGFMGESAKLLCPDKRVLMPDISADCAMAHMASIEKIRKMREEYEDLAVVCYINSTAELKCEADVCVTSSNAIKIVKKLPNKNIFFIPDGNLGAFVKEQVPEKNIILNDGFCPVHAAVTREDVLLAKKKHPDALVLTHPECKSEVRELSDFLGSTSDIIEYARRSNASEFIISTEDGVGFALGEIGNGKKFYFVKDGFTCMDMKLNTPERILHVLLTGENEIFIDEEKQKRAMLPLDRMLELAK